MTTTHGLKYLWHLFFPGTKPLRVPSLLVGPWQDYPLINSAMLLALSG